VALILNYGEIKYPYISVLEREVFGLNNMKKIYVFILTIFLVTSLFGQVTRVTGTISEQNSGSALIGVNVAIKDALEGTVSSSDGSFRLETGVPRPFWIVVSMIGYESREIEITRDGMVLEISLEDQVYLGQEVVVSASRIPESFMKSPVTVEKMSGLDIQQTSTANFFDGLHQLKGVDMNVHSLTFRYPNTRGFTGEANMRMNQIIDGIENIPPGLSFSAGNIFGVSQLDIDNVESGSECIRSGRCDEYWSGPSIRIQSNGRFQLQVCQSI
jgi:hypothetical protein